MYRRVSRMDFNEEKNMGDTLLFLGVLSILAVMVVVGAVVGGVWVLDTVVQWL